jgi:hypothetical protein
LLANFADSLKFAGFAGCNRSSVRTDYIEKEQSSDCIGTDLWE